MTPSQAASTEPGWTFQNLIDGILELESIRKITGQTGVKMLTPIATVGINYIRGDGALIISFRPLVTDENNRVAIGFRVPDPEKLEDALRQFFVPFTMYPDGRVVYEDDIVGEGFQDLLFEVVVSKPSERTRVFLNPDGMIIVRAFYDKIAQFWYYPLLAWSYSSIRQHRFSEEYQRFVDDGPIDGIAFYQTGIADREITIDTYLKSESKEV